MAVDLIPFGFTGTESTVYSALLRLGTATGYAVARATRLARANAYAALEGLVSRGAATKQTGRPARFRPTDPRTLLVNLATHQAQALERLERSFQATGAHEPSLIQEVTGARAVGNALLQLVARAERSVTGTIAAELWRLVLPGLRRAAARAAFTIRSAGEVVDDGGYLLGTVAPTAATLLLIDETVCAVAHGSGENLTGLWSTHPLIVELARGALRAT